MRCTRCKEQIKRGAKHKYKGGVYCDTCIKAVSPEARRKAWGREDAKMSNMQMAKDLGLDNDLGAKGL